MMAWMLDQSKAVMPNKIAAGNRHRAFSFDRAMKFEYHHCSQRQAPVAVPELLRSTKKG
jgi:hypothetical protein